MNLASFGRRVRSLTANVVANVATNAVAVASAITLTCGLWTHAASADNRVGEFVTSAEAWTYAPVITRLPDGAGGNVITVDNVLAVAKPGYASGDNLIAVWYVRETTGGTTWVAKTWDDTTWPGIAQRLKNDLGLTDAELEIFGQGTAGSAAASAPRNYTDGFVEGDPMATIVNDTDPNTRELLVDILKDTGYKIADPVFDEKDECGRDVKLNAYSSLSLGVVSATSDNQKMTVLQASQAGSAATCLFDALNGGVTEFTLPDSFIPKPEVPQTYQQEGECPIPGDLGFQGINGVRTECKIFKTSTAGTVAKITYRVVVNYDGSVQIQTCNSICDSIQETFTRCCAIGICVAPIGPPPCGPNEFFLDPTPASPYRPNFILGGCDLDPSSCSTISLP